MSPATSRRADKMLERLSNWLTAVERKIRTSFGDSLETPAKRRQAWLHFQLFDHAFLRVLWTNFDEVAPGVYRSNHPGPKRLERYHKMGIKTVLNLRGEDRFSPWLFEKEACDRLGMDLVVAKIYARKAARKHEVIDLIDKLKTIEKPCGMQCKAGADRAGFASVRYKVSVEGASLEEARKHLSFRYIHLKSTDTGIVDHDEYQVLRAGGGHQHQTGRHQNQ